MGLFVKQKGISYSSKQNGSNSHQREKDLISMKPLKSISNNMAKYNIYLTHLWCFCMVFAKPVCCVHLCGGKNAGQVCSAGPAGMQAVMTSRVQCRTPLSESSSSPLRRRNHKFADSAINTGSFNSFISWNWIVLHPVKSASQRLTEMCRYTYYTGCTL